MAGRVLIGLMDSIANVSPVLRAIFAMKILMNAGMMKRSAGMEDALIRMDFINVIAVCKERRLCAGRIAIYQIRAL